MNNALSCEDLPLVQKTETLRIRIRVIHHDTMPQIRRVLEVDGVQIENMLLDLLVHSLNESDCDQYDPLSKYLKQLSNIHPSELPIKYLYSFRRKDMSMEITTRPHPEHILRYPLPQSTFDGKCGTKHSHHRVGFYLR